MLEKHKEESCRHEDVFLEEAKWEFLSRQVEWTKVERPMRFGGNLQKISVQWRRYMGFFSTKVYGDVIYMQ